MKDTKQRLDKKERLIARSAASLMMASLILSLPLLILAAIFPGQATVARVTAVALFATILVTYRSAWYAVQQYGRHLQMHFHGVLIEKKMQETSEKRTTPEGWKTGEEST